MKKNILTMLLCLIASVSSGCATYIRVPIQKPSEINIGKIKKISIEDFTVNGNVRLGSNPSLGAIAAQALVDIAFEQFGKKNNRNERGYKGSEISNQLFSKLNNTGYFRMIKRNNQAKDVEGVVTGFINYDVRDYVDIVDDTTTKNGITINNKKFRIKRSVDTSISYQILNLETGRVIASRTNSDSDYDTATGDTQEEAERHLRNWYYMVDSQVNTLTNRMTRQIAPYYVTQELEIKDGKSNNMKRALEYAKRYLWDDARKQWQEVLANPNSDKEDSVFATYNLGVYHEVKGELEEAGKFFDECFKKSGKSECVNSKSRIETRKIELERLTQSN